MASPQVENGYTRIANELMEALARIRIPGEARQIVDTIFRKTYGFNKKEDMISLSQFCLTTGMKKSACSRAIKTVSTMNIIIKKDNGGIHFYSINKDFETWKPLSKKITHIIEKDNGGKEKAFKNNNLLNQEALSKKIKGGKSLSKKIMSVIEKDNIQKTILQKTKENIPQKKKSTRPKDGFSAESVAYKLSQKLFNLILINNPYSRLHACGNGDKETILQRWATDIDLLIRKDGLHPSLVEEVITFTANDHFWGPNVQSGLKLRMKWDTLVAQMKKKGVSSSNASKLAEESSKSYDAAGRKLNYV
jgi:phage replication O-like protein O